MLERINTFLKDEDGAVTVDWVVLTASVVFLCLAVIAVVGPATTDLGNRIKSRIDTITP